MIVSETKISEGERHSSGKEMKGGLGQGTCTLQPVCRRRLRGQCLHSSILELWTILKTTSECYSQPLIKQWPWPPSTYLVRKLNWLTQEVVLLLMEASLTEHRYCDDQLGQYEQPGMKCQYHKKRPAHALSLCHEQTDLKAGLIYSVMPLWFLKPYSSKDKGILQVLHQYGSQQKQVHSH